MPTEPESEAYVLGVRANQLALVLQMEPEPTLADAHTVQSFALRYRQALATNLLGDGHEAAHLRRRAASIEETAASEREGIVGNQRNLIDLAALQTDMRLAATLLSPATRDWLRLGIEIVDGSESRRREGPPMVPGAHYWMPNPGLPEIGSPPVEGSRWDRFCGAWLAPNGLPMPPSSVTAIDATDHSCPHGGQSISYEQAPPLWAWRNPQRLQELLNSTAADLGQLLPMFDQERWSFAGIEARDYWLWEYIEVGISRLARQTPSCDLRSNRLIFGDTTIRALPRRGSVQRQLVDAFNDEGWPSAVEFTTDDSEQRSNAIYALNNSLRPKLMHFAECGDDVQWFPGPRPSQDTTEPS